MLQEITLSGQRARLEPLRMIHATPLWHAAQAPEIWEFSQDPIHSLTDAEVFIESALKSERSGDQLPFAIRDLNSGHVVGTTRLADYSAFHRGAEIGWTWLSPDVWKTRINTECKFLLLQHGFETLNLLRICLKTDARNQRSQRAIERLGAQQEGVLRSHRVCPDGFVRDSVFYSILDREWPSVKRRLEGFLST